MPKRKLPIEPRVCDTKFQWIARALRLRKKQKNLRISLAQLTRATHASCCFFQVTCTSPLRAEFVEAWLLLPTAKDPKVIQVLDNQFEQESTLRHYPNADFSTKCASNPICFSVAHISPELPNRTSLARELETMTSHVSCEKGLNSITFSTSSSPNHVQNPKQLWRIKRTHGRLHVLPPPLWNTGNSSKKRIIYLFHYVSGLRVNRCKGRHRLQRTEPFSIVTLVISAPSSHTTYLWHYDFLHSHTAPPKTTKKHIQDAR